MSIVYMGKSISADSMEDFLQLPEKSLTMLVDVDRCILCHSCEVACSIRFSRKDSLRINPTRQFAVDSDNTPVFFNFSTRCCQCDEHPCVGVCPVDANEVLPNGIVVIDNSRCIDCSLCLLACGKGLRVRDNINNSVIKCDFCMDRVAQGMKPACVSKCIMHALSFGVVGFMSKIIEGFIDRGYGMYIER